jgi:hypothetical protein
MDIDPFAATTAAVTQLLVRHGDLLVPMGQRLAHGLAIIMLAWFGIQRALSSTDGEHGLGMAAFARLLLLIALTLTMLRYYREPIPGIGSGLGRMLTDQPLYIAHQIETSQVQMLSQRLADVYLNLERPFALNALHFVGYLLVSLAVTAARVALLAVTAFGIVATGVAALLGPVFIPFLIVPALDWLFWGWLKSLIQYAFYQVVAQAFAYVFGTVLINFLDAFPPPYTIDRILVGGFHLVFLLLAFTYGMLQVPSLTNSLFSGRSGEAALPRRVG